jgi:hypothetical protein
MRYEQAGRADIEHSENGVRRAIRNPHEHWQIGCASSKHADIERTTIEGSMFGINDQKIQVSGAKHLNDLVGRCLQERAHEALALPDALSKGIRVHHCSPPTNEPETSGRL